MIKIILTAADPYIVRAITLVLAAFGTFLTTKHIAQSQVAALIALFDPKSIAGVVTALAGVILSWLHEYHTGIGSTVATPPASKTGKIPVLLFVLGGVSLFCAAGCTSFVTATGQNHVITTISSTCFGVNVQSANANNGSPSFQLGLIRQTVQFLPFVQTTNSNNGTNYVGVAVPDYAAVYDIQQSDPLVFNGYESFAAGKVATYEASLKTNTVTSQPALAH